jgi:hypothetical protein
VVLVVVVLVDCLGLLKAHMDVSKELVAFYHGLGQGSDPRVAWFIGADGGSRL